jgi:hypothetical protein
MHRQQTVPRRGVIIEISYGHMCSTWQGHPELIWVVRIPSDDIFRNRLVQIQTDQLRCVEAAVYDDLPSIVVHEADEVFLWLLQVLFLCSLYNLQSNSLHST